MQKCLGIYIESNIIKYAKVSKDRDDIKIESFGIRFFENLSAEISKIIEETFSFNVPISINLLGEKYLYFDIFALLSKKDIEKTVVTEFETFCNEKQYNLNAFENRYALTQNVDDKEKLRAIDIYVNKIQLNRQTQNFEKFKLNRVVPTPIVIGNIANLEKRENQLIVNMEEETTITTILNQQIYNIETLEYGSREVLDSINKVENSYAKAYDICKNTTIYTANVEETSEEQPYLQNIVPTLFKIVQRLQEIVSDETIKYQTIYLTGTLAALNNIDLYFQEFFSNVECKILRPKYVEDINTKVNMKDYIEVNSAIALAVSELGEGIQELNFRKVSTGEKLSQLLKIELKPSKNGEKKVAVKEEFKAKLDGTEMWLVRGIGAVLSILIIFCVFSKILSTRMIEKEKEITDLKSKETAQIGAITGNKSALDSKTQAYLALISDLESIEKRTNDTAARRNLVPNLLNQIMFVIPEKVQLISIKNTTGDTISIVAQSEDYEQLGYFIATLKTKSILRNIVSSSGIKNDGKVQVTIEGDLR